MSTDCNSSSKNPPPKPEDGFSAGPPFAFEANEGPTEKPSSGTPFGGEFFDEKPHLEGVGQHDFKESDSGNFLLGENTDVSH
jgi:hypothetical protein